VRVFRGIIVEVDRPQDLKWIGRKVAAYKKRSLAQDVLNTSFTPSSSAVDADGISLRSIEHPPELIEKIVEGLGLLVPRH
jgi:hypothetical protein